MQRQQIATWQLQDFTEPLGWEDDAIPDFQGLNLHVSLDEVGELGGIGSQKGYAIARSKT
jgi:hypothetical protein